jgi:hypothetical protein
MDLLHAGRLCAGLDSWIEAKIVIVWLDASSKMARGSDACPNNLPSCLPRSARSYLP